MNLVFGPEADLRFVFFLVGYNSALQIFGGLMKNKILTIIGAALVVAGAVVAAFTDVAVAEYASIAVAFVGAAVTCVSVYKKSEKKDWKVIVSIIAIAAGALLLGFSGISSSVVTEIVTAVAGIVALILGLFVALKSKK